jgi:hypothetical protein
MNKELIEKRLLELQKQLEQIQANGNATVGAIQECKYWLSQMDTKEE